MPLQAPEAPRAGSQVPFRTALTPARTCRLPACLPAQPLMPWPPGNTEWEKEGIFRLEVLGSGCGLRLKVCCLWQGTSHSYLTMEAVQAISGCPGCRVSPVPATHAGGEQWFVSAQMPTAQILCRGGPRGRLPDQEAGKRILLKSRCELK